MDESNVPRKSFSGEREAHNGTVSLRRLGGRDQEVLALNEAVARLAEEAAPPDA